MSVMTAPEKFDLIGWARALDEDPPATWQSVLDRLQDEFEGRYSIKRLPSCWMASDMDPHTPTEPTIIEDTVEKFVRRLLSPAPRWGRRYTRLWGPDRL